MYGTTLPYQDTRLRSTKLNAQKCFFIFSSLTSLLEAQSSPNAENGEHIFIRVERRIDENLYVRREG